MEITDIKEQLNAPGFNVIDCVKATGLHMQTIYRIRSGETKRLNPLTKKALVKYLRGMK